MQQTHQTRRRGRQDLGQTFILLPEDEMVHLDRSRTTVDLVAAASLSRSNTTELTFSPPLSTTPLSNLPGIYRSAICPSELRVDFPNVKTMYDAFQQGKKVSGNRPCAGHRPTVRDPITGAVKSEGFVWQTYNQISERRINFGCGLFKIQREVVGGNDKFNLGIYAVNRPEWLIADLATHCFSWTTVALYDTLGPETAEFILNHSEVPICVTSIDKVVNLIQLAPKVPSLKVIVSMDPAGTGVTPFAILKEWAKEKGLTLVSFAEVEALGAKNRVPLVLPKPEDAACISYTSGTTGNPKGAILTHGNLVSVLRAQFDHGNDQTPEDVHISYLPLAHVYERVCMSSMLCNGSAIGFSRGDVALLIEDIACLRPTVFASVPRLLNRIYDRVMAQGTQSGSALKTAIFKRALDAKLANLKTTGSVTHPFWDALVFNKVKAALGGRVRVILSGSAPISPDVLQFLRVAFCTQVLEGYGQTESTAGLTVSIHNDYDPNHVGFAVSCNEIKLVSLPEMSYLATDKPYPRGEIWVRGANVFAGYLKDEAKTKETITEDGWLKTGDVGAIDEKGRVRIIDRKKNIFKLAQGEYVAPEKIEGVYEKCSLVGQIFVHGDSLQSELVAIIVPDQEHAVNVGKHYKLIPESTPNPGPALPGAEPLPVVRELCNNAKFKELVQKELDVAGKKAKLRGFEFVKGIHLEADFFTVANGLLTPTFKLKRNDAATKYRPVIDKLYEEINAKKPPAPAKL
ncbi:hypothetical protein HDU97_007115 [Phlyctochytrium planicorne]|nr:hypothetical protein HDU97_007115 [Phlyctochytrium planicorne]